MTEINSLPDEWHVFDTAEILAKTMVKHLLELAEEAIDQRGRFELVTAGGTTPLRCYELLAHEVADWQNWYIYMGDERCLPADDDERNSVALHQAWLFFGKIPTDNIFYMPAEFGATLTAKAYGQTIERVAKFDVVMLGMGEDGHTASLFPGHDYAEDELVVTEFHSPKPPAERVSLSFDCLSNSRHVFKLVTGIGKRHAVQTWLKQTDYLPIMKVEGDNTEIWVDSAAL